MRHAEVVVELPADGDGGMLRTRVQKALSEAGFRADADEFVEASRSHQGDIASLLEICSQWVTVAGVVDDARASHRQSLQASTGAFAALAEPLPEQSKWQYAIVNIGMFNSSSRMRDVLSVAGQNSWELVTIFDKGSNWMIGMEKGFVLLKRPVPEGFTPKRWAIAI